MTTDTEITEEQKQAMWDELAAQPRGDNAPAAPSPAEPAPAAAATDAQAVPPQPAGEAPGGPAAHVDPIAALRAEFDAAKSLMERRVRSAEGRASKASEAAAALEARLAAAQQAQAAAPAQPTAQQVRDAAASSGSWNVLKDDYPEWAAGIDERINERVGKGDQGAVSALEKQLAEQRAAAAREREELSKDFVESVHPGWVDTINSPAFDTWIEDQPARVAKLADSAKPSDAIKLLNLFKFGAETPTSTTTHPSTSKSAAEIAAERQQRLESSVTAPRSNGSRSPSKSVNDMTPTEYWDYLAEQNRRKQGAT